LSSLRTCSFSRTILCASPRLHFHFFSPPTRTGNAAAAGKDFPSTLLAVTGAYKPESGYDSLDMNMPQYDVSHSDALVDESDFMPASSSDSANKMSNNKNKFVKDDYMKSDQVNFMKNTKNSNKQTSSIKKNDAASSSSSMFFAKAQGGNDDGARFSMMEKNVNSINKKLNNKDRRFANNNNNNIHADSAYDFDVGQKGATSASPSSSMFGNLKNIVNNNINK